MHMLSPSVILLASLAARERRFGAVPRVQASISLRVKPAESARKEWHWDDTARVANPEKPPVSAVGSHHIHDDHDDGGCQNRESSSARVLSLFAVRSDYGR